MRKAYNVEWNGRLLDLGRRTCVMGIVNVTPDSFSDGGRFFDTDAAVAQGLRLVAEGADILDIGGESTRPFSDPVSLETEAGRVVPVIEAIAARVDVPISIDTMKADVAEKALAAGASLVNDVSALRYDPRMAEVAAAAGVPVILMHMLGTPKTMQKDPRYEDLHAEVAAFLAESMDKALAAGIRRHRLILDPGIGFGKTVAHNLSLIRYLDLLAALNAPLLVGPSRKAFIRTLLSENASAPLAPDAPQVAVGTQAAVTAAILAGAHILRVHDVAATRTTACIADALAAAARPR